MDSLDTRLIADGHYIGSSNSYGHELSEDEQTVNSTYENTALENDSNNLYVKNCNNASDNNSTIYANYGEISRLKELQEIDRRPYPPFPDGSSSPLLVC
uniref:Uncharacterized protein n=1 Tax=Meloidogyne hapla TaxID=6305 RepID=A0A1I8AZZ2_MELHA